MKWQQKLNRARDLKERGSQMLFDRAKLLNDCYMDTEFHAWCEETDTAQLDYLDGYTDDLGVDFATLNAVFVANKDAESWRKHGFRYLLAELRQSQKAATEPRKVPSYKQLYEEACRKIEMLEEVVRRLQAAISGKCTPV